MVEPQGAQRSASSNVVALNARTKSAKATTFSERTGGPPSDGGDSWRSSVETRLGELRTDMRQLFYGGLVAIALVIGAGWLVYKDATNQMKDIAVQQQSLAGKLDTLDARMTGKFETLGVKIDDSAKQKDAKR